MLDDKYFVLYKILTKHIFSIIVIDITGHTGMSTHHGRDAMNHSKLPTMNKEDQLISKMTLSLLFSPLIFLVLAGAMIAV